MLKNTFLILFALAGLVVSAQPYAGRVFRDTNGNGVFDRGERPLAGVKVSDGINVVKTDRDGNFSLPGHDDVRFVFVTVPSGHYALRPWIQAGTTVAYDFALQPRREGDVIRFAQIADNETPDPWKWVDELRDYARNEKLDFILHSGDICYEPGIRYHAEHVTTSTMGVPMYYTMGNHDLMKKVDKPEYLYEESFGPSWYSFEAGGTHFIVLPMYFGDGKPTFTHEQTYRWLTNDLANLEPGQPLVVVAHHNSTLSGDELKFKSKEGEIDFRKYNMRAHIMGHWHVSHQRVLDGGVKYIETSPSNKGGKDHSPSAFRVVSIDKKGNITSKNVYGYCDMELAVVSPAETAPCSGQLNLSANAYNTRASVRQVSYTLASGRKTLAKGTLDRATDWNYNKTIKSPDVAPGDSLLLKVTAVCTDGTTRTAERRFAFGTLPQVEIKGQWTQLRGNEMHNQAVAAPMKGTPRLLWTANAGGNIFMASPIVAQGKVFTATMDNNLAGLSYVVAFDAATGAKLWSCPTANSVKNTIVYSSGKVFAMDTEGMVYAIDAANGQVVWTKTLEVGILPAAGAGLVIRGDTLYAGEGKGLSALAAADGTRYWKNEEFAQNTGTTVSMALAGNTLVSSVQWSGLYGTDIKTGKLLWHIGGPDMRYRDTSPSVYDGLIYVASNRKLYALNPQGDFRLLRHTNHVLQGASCPLITDDLFIVGTSLTGLMAFDKHNFDLKWTCETGPAIFYTAPYTWKNARTVDAAPVQVGSSILFGASDGVLRLADVADGTVRWTYSLGTPIFTTPAVVDGVAFLADFAGNVYAFAL